MEWINSIGKAIDYIEDNITQELTVTKIAESVFVSPFYFQKGFSMLCGFTVVDYIRQRRLSIAGGEIVSSDEKIIDIALKYGYDSPDSFTKAFTRFHGATPTAVRRDGANIKSFAPLKIVFTLKGGFTMDYKIVEKEAFKVVGMSKKINYDEAQTEVPKFWQECFEIGTSDVVCGEYGINIDENMGGKEFEYLIAGNYVENQEIPKGFIVKTIPAFTWAIFPCKGAMPTAIQKVNQDLFSQWLPNCKEYEFAAGYNIEMYADPSDYKNGVNDENYYCEVWIPIKKKG